MGCPYHPYYSLIESTDSMIWARRMVQITNFDIKTVSIHTLELKLWLFEVYLGSHSLAMFAHKKFWVH